MPDTFTHFALPLFFQRFFKRKLIVPALLIGAVLPDYLRECIFQLASRQYHPLAFFTHSLAGIFFSSIFIAVFFVPRQAKIVFLSLSSGQLIHLLLDSLQGHLDGGRMYWLLPLWKSFEINLVPEYYWMYIFAGSISVFIIYSIIKWQKIRG